MTTPKPVTRADADAALAHIRRMAPNLRIDINIVANFIASASLPGVEAVDVLLNALEDIRRTSTDDRAAQIAGNALGLRALAAAPAPITDEYGKCCAVCNVSLGDEYATAWYCHAHFPFAENLPPPPRETMGDEALATFLARVEDYASAPRKLSKDELLIGEWADKPHRVLWSLCAEVKDFVRRVSSPQDAPADYASMIKAYGERFVRDVTAYVNTLPLPITMDASAVQVPEGFVLIPRDKVVMTVGNHGGYLEGTCIACGKSGWLKHLKHEDDCPMLSARPPVPGAEGEKS